MRMVMKLAAGVWMAAMVAGCIYVVPVEVVVVDKETGEGVGRASVTTRYVGGAEAGKVRGGVVVTDAEGRAGVRVLAEPGKDGPAGTKGTEIHVEATGYEAAGKVVGEKGDAKVETLRTEFKVTGKAGEVVVELKKLAN